jgi:acetyl-CoA acetyltransferase
VSTMNSSIVLAEGVRTPMADYNGLFADTTATDLAVAASREALRRARGIVPLGRLVAEAVTGCDPAEILRMVERERATSAGSRVFLGRAA